METINLSLQQTLDLLPDGVLIVNEEGKIMMGNTQLEKLFGYAPKELNGQHLNVLIPPRFHKVHAGHLSGYSHHPVIRDMGGDRPLFGLRKDGLEFDVAIALSPVEMGNGKVTIATIRDVTEKKNQDRAMHWKNEQLEAINTELERFGYTVSHDLKSPLANIQAIIHLVTRELPVEKKEALREPLLHLNQTLYSMSELISGIAAYSKASIADATGVEIDTNELMKELRYLVLLPPHIKLDVDHHMPITWGNKTKLLQVFLNLVSNAIKYNDKEAGVVKVSGELTTDKVYFCVEDNGPGIAPELRKKVFTLFEKGTSERSDSQGIGLAIVVKVLKELGGRIEIDESPLGGARFRIKLPVVKPETAAA